MNQAAPPQGQTGRSPGGRRISNSGWVTPGLVGLLCLGLLLAAVERGHGNLKKITAVVSKPDDDVPPPTFRPGGQDPIRLSRSVTAIGRDPEFLSATLLPGRGMNVFQITAVIPGEGEIPILFSPQLNDAAAILTDSGADAHGAASVRLGGALLLPWSGQLTGTPADSAGLLQTTWNGSRLQFPAATGTDRSVEGLLLDRGASSVRTDVLPDGQMAEAVFHAGSFDGALPSTVDVTVHVELTGHAVELTVTATNTGKAAVPFGTGWRPMLAVPSGERANALLIIPSKTVLEKNKRTGLPTGKTLQVEDSNLDFSRVHGTKLPVGPMDETYTRLQPGLAAEGPMAELRDSAYNVSLRVVPESSNITSFRVISSPNKPWVAIQPSTNVDDPLGPEWPDAMDAGLVTLEPGRTVEFKVRLEIVSLLSPGGLQ